MVGRRLGLVAVTAAGLLVGLASGVAAISLAAPGLDDYGGWRTASAIGSPAAGPYTRAVVARTGLLALTRREAVYFTRYADDRGAPLSETCRYRLDGVGLPARWWSVTLYAADNFLAVNGDHAYAFDATRAPPDPAASWHVIISPTAEPGPWISSRNAGRFSLTLRLYNPAPEALAAPAAIRFPQIHRLSCRGTGA